MNPGFNLNNLKYFYDAAENESISESARKNFVTQSAVSQGILKLEKALKLDLISHQRNFFKLTVEGELLYQQTQQLFGVLKAMENLKAEQSEVISGEVSVTCTQSIAINLLATVLPKMKENYPQVTVKIKISKMEQICQMLKKGKMDLGIVVESDLCTPFQKDEIRTGTFHLYSKNTPILPGIYVDHHNGLFVSKLKELYRKRFKKEPAIIQELDSWQLLAKCASQSIGCCFLPDFIAESDPTLQPHPKLGPIPYRIVALHPQGTTLTRASRALLTLLKS